jgi:hypothetical protein
MSLLKISTLFISSHAVRTYLFLLFLDVILLGDLIDIARPGEEVEVTGTHSTSTSTSCIVNIVKD